MFVIIGIVLVFASLIIGYTMHHGNLAVLIQINEFIIIGGAAIGSVLISQPLSVVKKIITGIIGTLKPPKVSKKAYIELLQLLYEMFQFAKREGLIALEQHIENPNESSIMTKYPTFLSNHHGVEFLCDTLKVVLSGGVPAHDLEELMDIDIDAIHEEEEVPPAAVVNVADAFPGLGIVAAVLGIITTMGAINEGAERVGASVAAALVGTFFGVLMAYGVVGPIGRKMEGDMKLASKYLLVIKAALLSFAKGAPASVAVEYGRRSIDPENRPSFKETEEALKGAR